MSENSIITATPANVTFKNESLNLATQKIATYVNEVQTKAHENHIAISKVLADVSKEKLYEEDGFKSAVDYAMQTFGWKRANAYAMIQVGTKLNAGELPEGDFSVSQYREMLPLSKEEATEAVESGVIDSDMTAKEIREEVEALKPKAERKQKPEKVYRWYLDNVQGRKDMELSESMFAELVDADYIAKTQIKTEEATIKGYLCYVGGEIRFYAQGEEVKDTVDAEAEPVAESTEADPTPANTEAKEAVEG